MHMTYIHVYMYVYTYCKVTTVYEALTTISQGRL